MTNESNFPAVFFEDFLAALRKVQDENRIHGNVEVFELRPSPDGAVHLGVSWPFIGTDDFGREVFVDELGTIWKYTEPGAMPRERHDKLYTASSNGRDGEPGLPMSDAFDYKIIN